MRAEAESVEQILRMIREGLVIWVSSAVLGLEVGRDPIADRRRCAEALLAFAGETVIPAAAEAERARDLQQHGFGAFDALHLACAESGGTEVLLTTDDGLWSRARRVSSLLGVRVENPVSWLMELQDDRHS